MPSNDFNSIIIKQIEFTRDSECILIYEQTKNLVILVSIAESAVNLVLMENLPYVVNRLDTDPLSKRSLIASGSTSFYIRLNKELDGGKFLQLSIPVTKIEEEIISEGTVNTSNSEEIEKEANFPRKKLKVDIQEFKYLSEHCTKEKRVFAFFNGRSAMIVYLYQSDIENKTLAPTTETLEFSVLAEIRLSEPLESLKGFNIKYISEVNLIIVQTRDRVPIPVVFDYNFHYGILVENEKLTSSISVVK